MSVVSLTNPQSLNLYAYCMNDPVNQTDPSGLGFFQFPEKLSKWIGIAVSKLELLNSKLAFLLLPSHFRLSDQWGLLSSPDT